MNWSLWEGEGEGVIGVWLWFGAPNIDRKSNLSFAWHWHGGSE